MHNDPPDILIGTMSPRKREIARCIAKAFATRGYHAVGMRDLAGELGLNPGSLYHHFPSKDHALLSICLIGQAEIWANIRDVLAHHAAFDARVRRLFAAHLVSLGHSGDFIDVYAGQWQEVPHDLAGPLREGWKIQRAHFRMLFEDAAARGEIASDIPVKDAIRLLFGFYRTVHILHRTGRTADAEGFVDFAVAIFLRGITA